MSAHCGQAGGSVAHRSGIAGVKGGIDRLGEHDHSSLRLGGRRPLGRGHEDRETLAYGPDPGRNMAPEVADGDGQIDGRGVRLGLVEQPLGPGGLAGGPRRVGCVVEKAGSNGFVEGQLRAPLEGVGSGVVGVAVPRPAARLFECRAGGVVGPQGGQRQVPGPAVRIGIRQGVRQGPMDLSSQPGVGVAVHGRTDERVAELDVALSQVDQAAGLRRRQGGDVQAQCRRGSGHSGDVAQVTGGGEE